MVLKEERMGMDDVEDLQSYIYINKTQKIEMKDFRVIIIIRKKKRNRFFG